MSLTQQPRVWFSWNLQEKAFKQTLSISKVESEDTIAIWEKLNFRGSNRPKFHLNPKPEIFSKFVFVLSLHVWQDIDGAKGPRPRCAAWLQLDRASANNGAPFKRKTFLKINISIHPAVVCKKQKEKKSKGETQNHTARPPIRGRHRCLFDSRLSSFSELRRGALFVFEILKIRLQKPRKCARSEDGHWPPCDPADLWPAGKPSAASATGGCRGCRKGRRLANLLWEPREGVGQLVCSNWQPNHPTLHSCSLSQILV